MRYECNSESEPFDLPLTGTLCRIPHNKSQQLQSIFFSESHIYIIGHNIKELIQI